MTNFKKLMSLLMVLAMLVTFAAPTFAADETPETVTLKFNYTGDYEPDSDDVVVIQGEYSEAQKNEAEVLTQAVVKKGIKNFEIMFKKVGGYDVSIEISTDSNDKITLDSSTPFGRKEIANSSLDFSNNFEYQKKYYLKVGDSWGKINDNLTFKVNYTKKPIVDLIYVGGNKYTRDNVTNNLIVKTIHGSKIKSYKGDEVSVKVDVPRDSKTVFYVYSDKKFNTGGQFYQDGVYDTMKFKANGRRSLVLITYLDKNSQEEALNFNFLNVKSGDIKANGKDVDYKFDEGAELDKDVLVAGLTDGKDNSGDFDYEIINQVGFKYQISDQALAFKLEKDEKVTLDSSVAESESYPGFYDKGAEIKFNVAEEAGKVARVFLTKAGVMGANPLKAEADKSYKFRINADTKISVVYEDEATGIEEVADSYKAGGEVKWENLDKLVAAKILGLDDTGKILRLIDLDGKTIAWKRIEFKEKPAEKYTVTAKANIDSKQITIEPSAEGGQYEEGSVVTFTVPDQEYVKSINFKVGDGKENKIKLKSNNKYALPVTGNTEFTVVYYTRLTVKSDPENGSIKIIEPTNGKKFTEGTGFDKDSVVKFTVNDIAEKVIESVKTKEETLTADQNGVYSLTMDADKEVTLTYKQDPLIEKKKAAKEAISKLKNLTQEQIKEEQDKVEQANTVADVEKALENANKKDKAIKAKKDLTDKIDQAQIEEEAKTKLKEKVNAATVDTNFEDLAKEIDADINKEIDKEQFEKRKTELKNAIADSKLDAATKKTLTDKVDALENSEGLQAIRDELAAEIKKAEEKAKAEKELQEAKNKAKEKLGEFTDLTPEQKTAAEKAIDEAKDTTAVDKAVADADAQNTANKEKKEAEKALEEKKADLIKKIDEANLNDQEAVKALKKKVTDAKVGVDLEKLEEDILNGIQEEKDKENFDAEKDKLKKEIVGSKLDDTTKTILTQKLEKATKPEDLANIRKELAAEITKAEEKAKAEKELKEAKDVAKEEIKKLGYLSPEEQAAAEKAIADATDKAGVKKAVADAEELNEKHQKEAEAEKVLKEAKDAAKDTIGKLENLSPEEKKEALEKVDQAKNTDEIAEALKAAESKDALNKKAQEAKDAAEKAKDEAEKAKKAEEKAKEAEKAAKKAEEEKQAAEEKAKEAEKAKEEAAEKAKAAEEAAKEAKDKADAEPNNADLAEKAEEAKEAEKKAKQEAKEAEEKANKAEEEKQAAEKAAKKAEEEKQAAKEAAKEAENKAKEAAEKAKEAEEKAKEAEKNIPATADEKEEAKKIIENLPNLSSSDKNIYKNKVDQATTKGEVEEALKAAEKKSDENHNVSPSIPEYHGYFMEPSPSYLNNGYTPRKEEPKKEEPKKEEKKQEVATTSEYTTLYFYLDKGYYETMIDGQAHQIPMDVQPTAINQRTMLPIRFVAEAIGATVEWHQDTKSATFTKDGITATITLGKDEITVSDGRTIKMDAEPTVISQRIMVPLTNISQIFGLTNGDTRDGRNSDIEWDQENYRVIIKIKK